MQTKEKAIKKAVKGVIKAFKQSRYPVSAFYYPALPSEKASGIIERIAIRIPPILPDLFKPLSPKASQLTAALKHYKACPSIELIVVQESYQRHGVFNLLVLSLLNLKTTKAVTINNVLNEDFNNYLQRSSVWKSLVRYDDFPILNNFYTTKELFKNAR